MVVVLINSRDVISMLNGSTHRMVRRFDVEQQRQPRSGILFIVEVAARGQHITIG